MKNILVIGAGKFGKHLALDLCNMNNEVMLVDKSSEIIDELSDRVTDSYIGDYTVKSNLNALGVEDYDYVFVCVGTFKDSLIIVDHLKELGASNIIAMATSEIHKKFLLKNGADSVIYPEREYAFETAVAYSNEKIFDYIKLSDEAGIYEIEAPKHWIGKSLVQINVRKIHNITVIASKDKSNKVSPINSPDYVFNKDEHIIVMGEASDIRKITK